MSKRVTEIYQFFVRGTSSIPAYASCRLFDEDGMLKIEQRSGGILQRKKVVKTVSIPVERLEAINVATEWKTHSKNKSVIGRGIVGGALFGDVGATVGAVSGVGAKTKKTFQSYMNISYREAEGRIVKTLVFQASATMFKSERFAKYITEKYLPREIAPQGDITL